MVSLNYCPQCATARIGRFCAGCGLNLYDLAGVLAGLSSAVAPAVTPLPEQETPIAAPQAGPMGLEYGDAFSPDTDCHNCGSPLSDGVCALCSDV
jgi:hypothetical protein